MKRAALSLMLILATFSRARASGPAGELPALSQDFWAWRAVNGPITRDDVPRIERPRLWAPVWSAASVAARRKSLEGFEERWKHLSDSARPVAGQVDYRLVGSAISRVRWELDILQAWKRNPEFYVDQTVAAAVDLLLPSSPFDADRAGDLVARVDSIPRTLEEARRNLTGMSQPFARLAIEDLKEIGVRFRKSMTSVEAVLPAAQARELQRRVPAAVAALEGFRAWLEERVEKLPAAEPIGREYYVWFLRHVALLPFTPEELLAMGRQERERTVAFETYQSRRNAGRPELPIFRNVAEQVERARIDEESIRRFLAERKILTVPPETPRYGYRPLPEYLSALSGFGEETDFTSPVRIREGSTRYIPPPSARLGYFALSMARDPRADMVHEGIPGHAFQLYRSWLNEDEIRRHWYDSGANEGLGFYCEEMMQQMGLFDDSPKSQEMIDNYMRLRALRVEVDVRLALGTFTLEEAAAYFERNVPMDRATARGEAAAFASDPGFAIDYQIGKLQIVKLLADARRAKGEKFDLAAFHDYVWENGNVPLALLRWELLGDRSEVDLLYR
jgi:hypothetical protein